MRSSSGPVAAEYDYTNDGLLHTASYGGTTTLTNTWDAMGNRVGMTVNSTDYEFVYDATAGIPAVVEELKDGTPDVIVRYFREPGGELISRVEGANTSYYHFDALGSTRLLTTGVGESVVVTDKYAYDAYGSLISHDRLTGSVDQPYQYVGRLGYYTHWMEPGFGLMQLGVRFYDAEAGRFTQRDPIDQARWSDYAYASDGPVRHSDPTGLIAGHIIVHLHLCYKCHRCIVDAHATGDSALEDYLRNHPEVKVDRSARGRDQHNAVAHCVSRCFGRRKCGKVCATAWDTAYEAWLPVRGRLEESIMDLHNNEKGYEIADAGGSCVLGCIRKLQNGELYVLDPEEHRNMPY